MANNKVSKDENSGGLCIFPGLGACGLSNLGNTCYANSAMQCISYLPLLRSYLLSKHFITHSHLNRDNPLGTGGELLEEFARLITKMWGGDIGFHAPKQVRGRVLLCAKGRNGS